MNTETTKINVIKVCLFTFILKGRGRPRFFLPPGKIGGVTDSVTDKKCSEQSQPEMSITQIKFEIQCSFRTLFPRYSQDNLPKTTKAGHIMNKQFSCSHAKN